jgi:(1->4)-alpha-D-glucan 1-alpha-D-glucosylmutase
MRRPVDRAALATALATARRRGRANPAALAAFARCCRDPRAARSAVQRFQQLTGAAAAKGVEDTALYRWVPLAARNEVGGDPDAPLDHAIADLHYANRGRAIGTPRSLLCTSTHDTKRSADVRARLHVLSEMPQAWIEHVERWRGLNRRHRRRLGGRRAPDRNTEYLFYETLVGVWPGVGAQRREGLGELRERLQGHMLKAAREAKIHTSWRRPNPRFEAALAAFVDAALSARSRTFLAEVAAFASRLTRPAMWTALARTLVHLTAPGVPDL